MVPRLADGRGAAIAAPDQGERWVSDCVIYSRLAAVFKLKDTHIGRADAPVLLQPVERMPAAKRMLLLRPATVVYRSGRHRDLLFEGG